METTLQTRFAAAAGALVLAVALFALGAGTAQARPSLPELMRHHQSFAALAFSGGSGGAAASAPVPIVGGRSIAAGHGPVAFGRGRVVPVATTASTTGVYIGFGAVIVALAALATGLVVSERRSRSVAPAATASTTVSPMPSAQRSGQAGSEGSEGSQETRRKAA